MIEAGSKRIRPALMTTATTVIGLIPVFTAEGRGSDVMQPMAIPLMGGMIMSAVTILIVPASSAGWRNASSDSANEPPSKRRQTRS